MSIKLQFCDRSLYLLYFCKFYIRRTQKYNEFCVVRLTQMLSGSCILETYYVYTSNSYTPFSGRSSWKGLNVEYNIQSILAYSRFRNFSYFINL